MRASSFNLGTLLGRLLTNKSQKLAVETQLKLVYSETLKDHLANPRNVGELEDATGVAEQTNPVCGDRLRLSIRLNGGRIEASRFLAYGCPPTLACGSVLTELIIGMTPDEASLLKREDIAAALTGLPSRKQHAAALAIETLKAVLQRK